MCRARGIRLERVAGGMAFRHAPRVRLAPAKLPRGDRTQPPLPRRARDARDHRVPPADHAPRDPGRARRELLERAHDAARKEAHDDSRAQVRRRNAVPLPHDAGLPGAVRLERDRGPAPARRARRRPRRDCRREAALSPRPATPASGPRRGGASARGRSGQGDGVEATRTRTTDTRTTTTMTTRKTTRTKRTTTHRPTSRSRGCRPDSEDHRRGRSRVAPRGGGVDPRGPGLASTARSPSSETARTREGRRPGGRQTDRGPRPRPEAYILLNKPRGYVTTVSRPRSRATPCSTCSRRACAAASSRSAGSTSRPRVSCS